MSRPLSATVCALVIAATANAAVMQFSVDGVPVRPGQVVEVSPSDHLVIGIFVDLNPGDAYDGFIANVLPVGPWDPFPATLSDVMFVSPFTIASGEYFRPGMFGNVSALFAGYTTGLVDVDQVVVEWEVHIPDLAPSTVLALKIYPVDMFGPTELWLLDGFPPPLVFLPLNLHVIPEPATLALLTLSALVAIRRRR